jgi:L-alanine-DL-glutamate epimerase-like enolase superfamily enzyme
MVGCMMETRLALTAAAHLVCAQESILYADLDASLFLAEDPIIGGMAVTDGMVTLPHAPGLGLDVDPAFIATLRAA